MMFEYAIEILQYEIDNLEYKSNYPSLTAVYMSEGFNNKISELQQAISILKEGEK